MKVYAIEYLKDKSWFNAIQTFFTKSRYCHSAMVIDRTWCELDAFDAYKGEPDYHTKKYKDILDFLKNNPDKHRTEAYLIPTDFTENQCIAGIAWWKKRENIKKIYGFSKLLSFLWLLPLRPFMKAWYKRHGKPYILNTGNSKDDVCSIAVDKCIRHMGYDIFPEFDERCTYPGCFAEKLKKYKV